MNCSQQLPFTIEPERPTPCKAVHGLASVDILGLHLLRAALREHRGLMGLAVDAEDWQLAESILRQVRRLQKTSFI